MALPSGSLIVPLHGFKISSLIHENLKQVSLNLIQIPFFNRQQDTMRRRREFFFDECDSIKIKLKNKRWNISD